jgi:ABC-type dipeptide/oligopeptide/nickel transport system permease subunit
MLDGDWSSDVCSSDLLFIMLAVLSLNLVGDALRDLMDPKNG